MIAPRQALRNEINSVIREGLVAEGAISGPAYQGEKLVSRGLTRAEMAVATNYAAGDTLIFNRPYKTLGVEAGDERRGHGHQPDMGQRPSRGRPGQRSHTAAGPPRRGEGWCRGRIAESNAGATVRGSPIAIPEREGHRTETKVSA